MSAKLVKKSWLCRTLRLKMQKKDSANDHYVKYDGRGIGYEKVYVDGISASSAISWFWFTPRFEFAIDNKRALLKVRVTPWLTVQSLQLFVDDSLEYVEGRGPIGTDKVYVVMSLLSFVAITILLFVGIIPAFVLILLAIIF